MARKISDIYDGMITEKETQAQLTALTPVGGAWAANLIADLSSTSKVAIWRLLFWVVAVALWIHEMIFDQYVIQVTNIANTTITGPAPWYQKQALQFQYGDDLTYFNDHYVYNPVNPANCIVTQAAVLNLPGLVKVKVAGGTIAAPVALTGPQLIAFAYYMNLKKFAGTNLQCISLAVDLLQLYFTIVYNPLILDGTGQSIANPGSYPIEDAINAAISGVPFNGILSPTALITAIEAVGGVVNPVYTNGQGQPNGAAYLPIDSVLGYNPSSGYMAIDPAFPLRTTITYIAQTI